MEKVRLGRTNMMVSRLGFGSIPIQRDSDEEAAAVIKRCLDLGVTFLDTANAYSTSEERIGKAIAGQREKLILATKSLARTREEIEKHLQLSLKRLGVDYIDLYQFHSVGDYHELDMVLDPHGPIAVVEEAKKAGVVRHIGITSHQIDVAKKAIESDRFETIMFAFNFIVPETAIELLPLARKHDVGFIAMKALAGGMINNASIAFKYLRQFPDIVPLAGAEKVHHIQEIVEVLQGPAQLTPAEKREMESLKKELGSTFCHRCDYCQPCSAGIEISNVMSAKMTAKRIPLQRIFTGEWVKRMEKTTECLDCGDCEKRCPYHLPIRTLLSDQLEWYNQEKRKWEESVRSR